MIGLLVFGNNERVFL